MRFEYGAACDVGRRRRQNQDRYLANGALFAVADGLGGYAGGERAAQTAVDVLTEAEHPDSPARLVGLIGDANRAIYDAARANPRLSEMSTTLCAVADMGGDGEDCRLAVANVGDSRLYALAGGALQCLTVDHTISQNLVRDGLLTPEEAASHHTSHTLTRAVGYDPAVWVDSWTARPVAGTRLLICSDGVTNELDDDELAEFLTGTEAADDAAKRIVEAAVRPGHGRDNATAVVVDVREGTTASPDAVLATEPHPAVLA